MEGGEGRAHPAAGARHHRRAEADVGHCHRLAGRGRPHLDRTEVEAGRRDQELRGGATPPKPDLELLSVPVPDGPLPLPPARTQHAPAPLSALSAPGGSPPPPPAGPRAPRGGGAGVVRGARGGGGGGAPVDRTKGGARRRDEARGGGGARHYAERGQRDAEVLAVPVT